MQEDLRQFLEMFQNATKAISSKYMQLPVAGMKKPIYRERVYCYELYHCLRTKMERSNNFYSLCGELDKSGHPIIHENSLNKTKPDFLVHTFGNMSNNLAVIEVKPINAARREIDKDLRHLTAFHRDANYFAVYLIYGEDRNNLQRIKKIARSLEESGDGEFDLSLIHLYWHRSANSPVEIHFWSS